MEISKPIAIYCRVSTAAQEEQQTIQTQILTLKEFSQKNNFTIIKEYTDDGWSGDSIVRPALDQLRVDAKKKIWGTVLIYDPDRLARRYSYQELIMDELKEAGKEVIFVTISTPQNSEDKILYGVRGLFAEYERAKIAERFRLGKLRKIKEGHLLVSEALYGYNYIPKKNDLHGYYEINEEEAKVVKMIFSWVADEKLTLRGVVKRLMELNIRPRKSKRGVWNTSTLVNMFKNKGYIGFARWGSTVAVAPQNPKNITRYKRQKHSSRKLKPESEWLTVSIPPIIEKELFYRARNQLTNNFKLSKRNTKKEYLLAGKIFCECGRRRTGEGTKMAKNLYYRCSDRVLSFPLPAKCNEKGINAKITDNLVWTKIANLMSSPVRLNNQIKRWMNKQKSKESLIMEDIHPWEEEIQKLKYQEERFNKAYGADLLTLEQLKNYLLPIREKVQALQSLIQKRNERSNKIQEYIVPDEETINKFTEAVSKMFSKLDFKKKREIILYTVEKVIGTQEKLLVYGNIPLREDYYVSLCSNDRYGQSTIRHSDQEKEPILIPFAFEIPLPPPLKSGVDYGFISKNRAHP